MRLTKLLAIGLAVYSAAVLVLIRVVNGGPTVNDIFFIPVITGTLVGVILTLKRPDNRMGPLMVVMAAALDTLGATNVLIPMFLEQGKETLMVLAFNFSDLAWITQMITALVLLPLWFPTGRPLNRRWAWVGRVAVMAGVVAFASFAVVETVCGYDDPASDVCIPIENPWGIDGFEAFERVALVAIAMAIPAVASAFVRWRRADDLERHQMKWFFGGAVVLLVATAIAYIDLNQTVNNISFALGLTAVWGSISVAVLKFRLYDIDRIISRTITYALVVGLLVAAVAGMATLIGTRFQEPWLVAATTLGVAAVFNPLRRRIQSWVDRRFNRARYDIEQVMDGFASSLREEVEAEQVIGGLVEVVDETMEPAVIGIWVRDA